MGDEKIKLSPIEATAYWWINTIRYKVRDMYITGTSKKSEATFLEIFCEYTEVDWRNLYLELVRYIEEDVSKYEAKDSDDSFSQDTDLKGHARLNAEIAKIIGRRVTDIRLATNDVKDSVIYTSSTEASVWYKSCGIAKLPTMYEPSYVLTGDNKSLEFYNLLVATIIVIYSMDRSFKSVATLRERFCEEYMRLSGTDESESEVWERFNTSFNKADDKGILFGRSSKEMYFPRYQKIDLVGLDGYMDVALHYASVVLQKKEKKDEAPDGKSLKKQFDGNKKMILD